MLPNFVFAEVSSYLPGYEGDILRKYCGECTVRDEISGCTYRNGLLHSYGDKPAKTINGRIMWYKNGLLHREGDLPAVIDRGEYKAWYKNNLLHREGDLPAIVSPQHNRQEWWINGKRHRLGDRPSLTESGLEVWYKNGEIHRERDLPAVIDIVHNRKEWYKKGLLHREGDKPALIHSKGYICFSDKTPPFTNVEIGVTDYIKEWWVNGKRHRERNMPAVVDECNKYYEWWISDYKIDQFYGGKDQSSSDTSPSDD